MKAKKIMVNFFVVLLITTMSFGAVADNNGAVSESTKDIAKIFWNNYTVYPDETVTLYGGNFDEVEGVEFSRVNDVNAVKSIGTNRTKSKAQMITPLEVTQNSIKFVVPKNEKMGVYSVRIKNKAGFSEEVLINEPDPWWFMGDKYQKATSGGWIRVFGNALSFNDKASMILVDSNDKQFVLTPKSQNEYASEYSIPQELVAGNYKMYFHNGYGDESVFKYLGKAEIEKPIVKEENIIKISSEYSEGQDITKQLQEALLKAKNDGGGVIYFPAGRYKITSRIIIPQNVTLRGEAPGLVNLYWKFDGKPNRLIVGTDNFTIENLSIYVEGDHGDVITGVNNFKVQNTLIRANINYARIKGTQGGVGVRVLGSGFEISNCDILSTGTGIFMLGKPSYGIIKDNLVSSGQQGYMSYNSIKVIIENNKFEGVQLAAGGTGFGGSSNYFIYHKNNVIRNVYGGDREAITTDDHGGAYLGNVDSVDGTDMVLKDDPIWGTDNKDKITVWNDGMENYRPDEEWHTVTVYILEGKGAGQYRNLIGCEGKNIKIEKPWDIEPDENSIISIGIFHGRYIFDGITFIDSGTSVQLYPPNMMSIIANSSMYRAGSLNANGHLSTKMSWGGMRVEPSWYSLFVDNTIYEGNSWGTGKSVLYIGGTNDLNNIRMSRGQTAKRNKLMNNSSITVSEAVEDAVVEKNEVKNNKTGIEIRTKNNNTPTHYILRENLFENVTNEILK